jgi:hypothetical protein
MGALALLKERGFAEVAPRSGASAEEPSGECQPDPKRSRRPKHPKILINGHNFCSVSEAACGILLSVLLPNFKLQEGETFQIPIGHSRTVDFKVGETLVEFHPLRLAQKLERATEFYSLKAPKRLVELARLERQQYRERREKAVAAGPLRSSELIIVTTPQELFLQVICRFTHNPTLNVVEFCELFWSLVDQIKRESRGHRSCLHRRRNR